MHLETWSRYFAEPEYKKTWIRLFEGVYYRHLHYCEKWAASGGQRVCRANLNFEGLAQGGFTVAEDVEAKVKSIVAEQLGVDQTEISPETSFVNDLNADSLDTVELVMEFEDEFDMSIPDEEAEKIQTVGQAIDHIQKYLDNKGGD